MNIRIGNDVRVLIPLNTFGNVNQEDVKFATCSFAVNRDSIKNIYSDQSPVHIHHLTPYTIHGCGIPEYNVYPQNDRIFVSHPDPQSHGSFFSGKLCCNHDKYKEYGHNVYTFPCRIINGNLVCVFPAESQCIPGKYDCHFDVKILESNWDIDNLHSYRASYYENFVLVEGYDGGVVGPTTIILNQSSEVDTYIFSQTDAYLTELNGNYSSIINSMQGFKLNSLINDLLDLKIEGTGRRIIILSKYDNLSILFNSFKFPMRMYKISNGYYLYVSVYTYSDYDIKLNIIASDVNETLTNNPYENNSSVIIPDNPGSSDNPDTPSTDNPTTNLINTVNGDTIKVYGTISSNDLKIKGTISNNIMNI